MGVATTSLLQVAFVLCGTIHGEDVFSCCGRQLKMAKSQDGTYSNIKSHHSMSSVNICHTWSSRESSNGYGSILTSEEFKSFLEVNSITHSTSSSYHPDSNGLAERAVQSFKQSMRKFTSGSIESKLSRFSFIYHLTPHATTSQSQAELLYKHRPQPRLDILVSSIEQVVERRQDNQKKSHDIHSATRVFAIGDSVFIKDFRPGSKHWLPGKIVVLLGPVSARVKLLNGEFHRCHFDHIQMCQAPDQDYSPVTSVDSNTEDWTSSVPMPIPVDSQSADSGGISTLTCPPTSNDSATSIGATVHHSTRQRTAPNRWDPSFK